MANRLKAVRKALGMRQGEIATLLGIAQSTYSYWENDSVSIDHKAMVMLAKHFKVSLEFLCGEEFTLRRPPEVWQDALANEYKKANEYKRLYMEYLYGEPVFNNISRPLNSDGVSLSQNEVMLQRGNETIRISIPEDKIDVLLSICKAFSTGGDGNA